jgi:hypothetical protein
MKRIRLKDLNPNTDKILFHTRTPYKTPYTLEYRGLEFEVEDIDFTVNWMNDEIDFAVIQTAIVTIEEITIHHCDIDGNISEVILADSDVCLLSEYLSSEFYWSEY